MCCQRKMAILERLFLLVEERRHVKKNCERFWKVELSQSAMQELQ